jgi:N-carbamoylputrescine amidase
MLRSDKVLAMTMTQPVRIGVWQGGPCHGPLNASVIDRVAEQDLSDIDLLVMSELALSPYIAVSPVAMPESAVAVDGPEFERLAELAAASATWLVVSFVERGTGSGVSYNSVALIGPDGLCAGEVVSGRQRGTSALTYRKVHLSENRSAVTGVHEKYHFKPGDGFLVWRTPLGTIAPIICYDRSFSESWRTVKAAGAEIVVVPIATSRPERVRMLEAELVVAAVQTGVVVASACKSGREELAGATTEYSGGSIIIAPDGEVLARAESGSGDCCVSASVGPDRFRSYARVFHYDRDRRPEAYRADGAPAVHQPKEIR